MLSTRGVALRAGVPIGSVYRFFPNKRAMATALAHRNLDRYAERVAARLTRQPVLDAYATIDVLLDEYIAMKRDVPGFALVDFGVPGSAEAPDDEPNHLVAERIHDLLAARPADDALPGGAEHPGGADPGGGGHQGDRGHPGDAERPGDFGRLDDAHRRGVRESPADMERPDDPEALRRKVLVGVEAADALLRLAFRTDPDGDPALIAETRELLRAYLGPVLR